MSKDTDKQELVRILAVDDSRLMRKAVARILKGMYDVVEAEHGEDAWEQLQQDETIKIVCCDLSMPIMDGFGFLQLVRNSEDDRIREMPIIIVTGQEDSEENRNKIFEAGASDFVSKPFDSAQLRASIKTHIQLGKTAEELRKKTNELEDVAAVDSLTGLGTMAFFRKSAEQAISYAKRHERELVIVRLEIDGFRDLFMKLGKEKSSALIKKVGEILSKHTRQEDMLCRMGLDGFAALLRTSDLGGAVRMTERARDMITHINLQHGDGQQKVSVSVGVAKVITEESTTVDDLLQAAGKYLQKAQQAGGNQVGYDKASAKVAAVGDLTVEQALYLISNGQADKVSGQVDGLVQRVSPLLGLYAKVNAKGLNKLIGKLQQLIK
jgi:diguanylate cyclase (GGDEF)-like protein